MAQRIRDVMIADPVTVGEDSSAVDAAEAMRSSDVGDVIVLDDSQQICGVVTDRDIAIRLVADGRDPSATKVREICSADVTTVSPDDAVDDAVRLMREKAVRRLPVVDNGKPIGIVSIGDLAVERDPDSALADISAAPPNE